MVDLYIFKDKVDFLDLKENLNCKDWSSFEDLEEGYTMTFRIETNKNNSNLWHTEVKGKAQGVRVKPKN